MLNLLRLLVFLPPFALMWGREDGVLSFVLFREPKLVAITILGWTFLGSLFVLRRGRISVSDFASVVRYREIKALGLFLAFAALSGVWGKVFENYYYELSQWLLLYIIVIVLLVLQRTNPSVSTVVENCLIASIALVSIVSICQLLAPVSFLAPVSSAHGVFWTSTMGYKNPMALSILAQIFLVARRLQGRRASLLTPGMVFWAALTVAEVVLLLSLKSRASFLGLIVGVFILVGVHLYCRERGRVTAPYLAAGLVLVVGLVSIGSWLQRDRMPTVAKLVVSPGHYFDTDRGTYLLNTVNMAMSHPVGVGLGDWQTFYPLYRAHNRWVGFNEEVQARRAHSDPVQILGEMGWPGLALWLFFVAVVLHGLLSRVVKWRDANSGFLLAQFSAVLAASSVDYFVETPYNKFQFVLVLFLIVSGLRRSPDGVPGVTRPGIPRTVVAVVVISAVAGVVYSIALGERILVSASIRSKLRIFAATGYSGERVTEVHRLGERFWLLRGHTKTLYRDYAQLAEFSRVQGDSDRARLFIDEAIRLHPYDASSYAIRSLITPDSELRKSDRWMADFILHHATNGLAEPESK